MSASRLHYISITGTRQIFPHYAQPSSHHFSPSSSCPFPHVHCRGLNTQFSDCIMVYCTSFVLMDPPLGDREQSPIRMLDYNSNIPITSEGPADSGSPSASHHSPPTVWKPLSPILSPYHHRYRDFGSPYTHHSVYPSPPPSSTPPGRTVPLPSVNVCGNSDPVAKQPIESFRHPLWIGPPPSLESSVKEPLSPPPTLPTQTLLLPPVEPDPTLYQEMQIDNDVDLHDSPLFPLGTGGGGYHHPASPPLSPGTAYITPLDAPSKPASQVSLFLPSADTSHPSPVFAGEDVIGSLPFDSPTYTVHDFRGPSSSRRLWQPDPTNFTMNHGSTKLSDTITPTSFSSPQQWYLPEGELEHAMAPWGYTPASTGTPLPYTHITDVNNHPPELSPPFLFASSPLLSSPASSDYDFEDYDDGFMSLSPPSSPASLRSFSELPTVEDEEDSFDGTGRRGEAIDSHSFGRSQFSHSMPTSPTSRSREDTERAPSIRSFPGVETDDELIPLDLASRSSAPEHCIVIPSTPYITPSTFLSFPSSSRRDRNLPDDATANYNSGSLLLHDDYPINSPPDNSHFDLELDNLDPSLVASDPELKGLVDLRRRVMASERQAKLVEAQYENIKSLWLQDINTGAGAAKRPQLQQEEVRMQTLLAMQAKKARKLERERLKEINALIKTKLSERGVLSSAPAIARRDRYDSMDSDSPRHVASEASIADDSHQYGHMKLNKDKTTDMPPLVARMILRRRETRPHPLTKPGHRRSDKGSALASSAEHIPGLRRSSPLALTASPSYGGPISDETVASQTDSSLSHNEHSQLPDYPPLQWHMDVDCHACQSDTSINSLDDLDLASPFDMLCLSDA